MSIERTNLQNEYSEDLIQLRKNLKLETHRRHKENKISAQEISNLNKEIKRLNQELHKLNANIKKLENENSLLTQQTREAKALKTTNKELLRKVDSLEHTNDALIRQNTAYKQQIVDKENINKEIIKLSANPTNSRVINLGEIDDSILDEKPQSSADKSNADANQNRYNPLSWFGLSKKQSPAPSLPNEEVVKRSASPEI